MKKSLLYRLFGIGAISKKYRPGLEQEGIVVADEGIGGSLTMRKVQGPGRRYSYKKSLFTGWLVITKQRIVCYAFGFRQIDIPVSDSRITELQVENPKENILTISFEASVFRPNWSGNLQFKFKTDKAKQLLCVLCDLGAGKQTIIRE